MDEGRFDFTMNANLLKKCEEIREIHSVARILEFNR